MKKLVKAKTSAEPEYMASDRASKDGTFKGLLKSLFLHDKDLIRRQTYSTYSRTDGSLIYTHSESEHSLYSKVPDIHFVGWGTWIYE